MVYSRGPWNGQRGKLSSKLGPLVNYSHKPQAADGSASVIDSTGKMAFNWIWHCPRFYYNCCCWNYWAWWKRCWFIIYVPFA